MFFWEVYQQVGIRAAETKSQRALDRVSSADVRISQLETKVELLKLINVVFAELLVEKLGLTEQQLIEKINEVDMRDGVKDGRISAGIDACPECNRPYNARLNKCLYCGFSDSTKGTIFDKLN